MGVGMVTNCNHKRTCGGDSIQRVCFCRISKLTYGLRTFSLIVGLPLLKATPGLNTLALLHRFPEGPFLVPLSLLGHAHKLLYGWGLKESGKQSTLQESTMSPDDGLL